jgi:hypothetical protein
MMERMSIIYSLSKGTTTACQLSLSLFTQLSLFTKGLLNGTEYNFGY